MSYIETRNSYFVDLLSPEQRLLDQNSIKLITTKKIGDESEGLQILYKGT